LPTLTQLEYALAIDRERHFGKAAKTCLVSQPSLSALLIKLENELGYAIFDRSKKPIVTTEEGEEFLREAREIMTRVESLGQLRSGEQISGQYRLGIIPTMAPTLLPLLIPSLSGELPNVDFHIFEMKTSDIIRSLSRDEIDGGILATPLNEGGIHEEPLFYEPFLFYTHSEDSTANAGPMKEEEIDGKNLWLIGEGHCFRGQVMEVCRNPNRSIYQNIHLDSSGMETVIELSGATNGTTLVPYLNSKRLRPDSLREFIKPWPAREVSLVTSRPKFKSKIHKKICDIIVRQIPRELRILKNKDVRVVGLSKN